MFSGFTVSQVRKRLRRLKKFKVAGVNIFKAQITNVIWFNEDVMQLLQNHSKHENKKWS